MSDLFPDFPGDATDGPVPDAIKRGKHYVEPKGYAAPPGTGPAGETCGTCEHLCRIQRAKVYLKCYLARARWTGGGGTDVRSKSPACKMWQATKKEEGK